MLPRQTLPVLAGICLLASCHDRDYYDTGYSPYANGNQPHRYAPLPDSQYPGQNPPAEGGENPGQPYYGESRAPDPDYSNAPGQVPDTRTAPLDYPVAERTANPNFVISPFDRARTIDISGFKPGQLVRDPENRKVFRVP